MLFPPADHCAAAAGLLDGYYNADRKPEKIISGEPGGFYWEYIYDNAKENVAVREVHDLDGTLKERRTYEYTSILDKAVVVNQWTAANVDGLLFPMRSKYLLDKMTVEYDGSIVHSTFSYELDQYGYVVKGRKVSDKGHHKEEEWTYDWQ